MIPSLVALTLWALAVHAVADPFNGQEPGRPLTDRHKVLALYRLIQDGTYVSHRHETLLRGIEKRSDYVQIAVDFAKQKVPHATFRVVNDHYEGMNGVRHVYLKQTHNGIDIVNADMNINVAPDGSILSYGSSFSKNNPLKTSALEPDNFDSPLSALKMVKEKMKLPISLTGATVRRQGKLEFNFEGVSGLDEPAGAKLKYYKMPDHSVRAVWTIRTFLPGDRYDTYTDAAGTNDIIGTISHIRDASYKVFPWPVPDPTQGEREVLVDPWDLKASKFTWQGDGSSEYDTTQGNNVIAQENWKGTWKGYKNKYRPHNKNQEFIYDYDPNSSDFHGYIDASLTQVFYTVNTYHDILYGLGFDERNANYQANNDGQGGKDGDFVIVMAQDSKGKSNAAFSNEVDGRPARMELYMYHEATPWRDPSFDLSLVIHEATHGLSLRLVGGPANLGCLGGTEGGGMGEGWSDAFANAVVVTTAMNRSQVLASAAWVANKTNGERTYPYSTDLSVNPWTYELANGLYYFHDVGEVWAVTLYDLLWDLIEKYGIDDCTYPTLDAKGVPNNGRHLWMKLNMDAMELLPCSTDFIQGRDAILDADGVLTGGKNECLIWKAFARRGVGDGAMSDTTTRNMTVTASFDIPDGVC